MGDPPPPVRRFVIGTAGHIDHGKTAVVKALTGVDTDRWEEEKRRGITIDLGFAPLPLGDAIQASVVDVPGHEGFVRNMLAGATGIDVALLVVAADEGLMPQTEEHLRSEEHTSELQSRLHLVCRLLLEKKKTSLLPCEPVLLNDDADTAHISARH